MISFIPAPIQKIVSDPHSIPGACVIAISGTQVLLLRSADGKETFPSISDLIPFLEKDDDSVRPREFLMLGELNGQPCYGVHFSDFSYISNNSELSPLFQVASRYVLATFSPEACFAICRARELLVWRRAHRFCGACGASLNESCGDISFVCSVCGNRYYPQIAPAVIVLVTRGNQILLAHNRANKNGMFGLIAGFVEAGESAEQAAERELLEETGISIKNLTYSYSQSWPFPNSLMLGFRAEFSSGNLHPDGEELDQVRWFSREDLPVIPPPGSIAHRLLTDWLEESQSI